MRLRWIAFLLVFLGWTSTVSTGHTWGFFAHKRINRLAVMTLPTELMGFYKSHLEFITEHAVDPDKRRYAVTGEAPRHYIDIDHYGADPFAVVPRSWKAAVEKFSEDTLQAYGIVPWHLNRMVYRLTEAFKSEDVDRILRVSADLGHYVGDAHVPLHTTENYNGQLTGQRGIHGFWESRLPELKSEEYDFLVGRAKYLNRPSDAIWEAVEASHAAVDSVLRFERELNAEFPTDRKYGYEQRGVATVKTYSREYSEAYHARLNGMVERRMRAAIHLLGCLWYTAWVNAGKPDLTPLRTRKVSAATEAAMKKEEAAFRSNSIKGRPHEK